jgi:hypothetical protein
MRCNCRQCCTCQLDKACSRCRQTCRQQTLTNFNADYIQVAIYRLLQDHPKQGHLPLDAKKMLINSGKTSGEKSTLPGDVHKVVFIPCVASIRHQTSSISVVTHATFVGNSKQQAMHGAFVLQLHHTCTVHLAVSHLAGTTTHQ